MIFISGRMIYLKRYTMLAKIKTVAQEIKVNKKCVSLSAEFRNKAPKKSFIPFSLDYLSDADKNKIIADADRAVNGEYQIYNFNSYSNPEWRRDFQSGLTVKESVCTRMIRSSDIYGNADIKNFWEQSHLHPVITLAQAFCLSGNEKYAEKAVSLICDFIENEACGRTICWKCPMDVAIRLANIVECSSLISKSRAFSEKCGEIFVSISEHILFVCNNYENRGKYPNNHYLSDLTGVIFGTSYLCTLFESEQLRIILNKALEALSSEIERQINSDGSDYENSTYYHCFVSELTAETVSMLELNNIDFPETIKIRSQKMLDVCKKLGAFEGTLPLVGDQDGSRLFHKKGCFDIDRCDFSSLSCFYEGVENGSTEDMGIYILDDAHWKVYFKCGKTGTAGKGTHDHNDQLSISAFYDGIPVITDSGTYCYTLDEAERRRFRSVLSHSTVYIGIEQNDISDCFSVRSENCGIIERAENDMLSGRFEYSDGTVHKRTVSLKDGKLTVSDEISSSSAKANFIFGTDVNTSADGNGLLLCFGNNKAEMSSDGAAELKEVFISRAYGIKEKTKKVEISFSDSNTTVIQRSDK